ncbi:MAG: hypothetical protein COC05_02535 [Gammaproteobacteria bacterium]|nr:MAG: hypothetical protein COC05_02535 [Gammaproteobacteria bacterium]
MNDGQRSMAVFQAQPEGLGLCSRPVALSLAYVESPHHARSALHPKGTSCGAPGENRGLAVWPY